MSTSLAAMAAERGATIRDRLRRRRLLFLQMGSGFGPVAEGVIEGVGGTRVDIFDFLSKEDLDEIIAPVIVTGVERFAFKGESQGFSLGQMRSRIEELLQRDVDVCLVSSQPRIAYHDAPGSSLIEDSAFCAIALPDQSERSILGIDSTSCGIPSVVAAGEEDLEAKLVDILSELGTSLLASLDYYIFEVGAGPDFVELLEPRELEALRGAGLLMTDPVRFAAAGIFRQFKDAVADCLASEIAPQHELGRASEGLWAIERRIRRRLRAAAYEKWGKRWRKSVLPQDLSEKVLERARRDTNVTARTVAELRDPIEWLSLGELLLVVRSGKFSGLGIDEITWRKFEQDVLPIRNRLAHMRFLKRGDPATVGMWLNRVKGW